MSLYDELLAKQQNSVNAVKNLQTDVKDLAPLAQQYSGVQQNLTPYQKSPSSSTGNSIVNIAKETFSIGKTVLGKAGNFVLHTPEYVYQDMKPFLQATADVVTFKFQSEMSNITKQTMQLDAISAKYDKMFSSGQMGKEQYLRLKQDLAASYDDLSKQSTDLTKQAAQEGDAKKIATSAAMTAFDILSVGRYKSLKATTPIVKTGGVVSKSMSEGTFNALSKLTATVESAFQKIPSVRELMVRNAKYFAAVESKQLIGESALQFTGRELKNAAVGLILKRPIVYEMNVGLVKDTYDDIVNRNWNNGIQDGVVSDAAWLALQAVGGGPVKWISDHFGKTAQAVKKWSKGTPSLIDEISRRIGTKEADQIAKKLADGTLDNDMWQKIAAINLHMTDGDVARAASNILGNFEAGMDMTRVTPEYLEKNFKNWKTAFDIGTELEQKAIKAGKESKYVAVRWDAHSKYVFAKQAEQVINSSTDIEDIVRKLTALLDHHDFGQVDTLRNELLALYKPAMSGADYAKAVKKIVTATNTKVMKNISVKLKKQLDATGYLLAEVKNRITPAEGEYDIKKLVTAYSSGEQIKTIPVTVPEKLKGLVERAKKFTSKQEFIASESKITLKGQNAVLKQEALKYKNADEFVKAQGEPMYHGSQDNISNFDLNHLNTTYMHNGLGVNFTPDKKFAQLYARGKNQWGEINKFDNGKGMVNERFIPDSKVLDLTKNNTKVGDVLSLKHFESIAKNGTDKKFARDNLERYARNKLSFTMKGDSHDWAKAASKMSDSQLYKMAYDGMKDKPLTSGEGLPDMFRQLIDVTGLKDADNASVVKQFSKLTGSDYIKSVKNDGSVVYTVLNPEKLKTKQQLTDIYNQAHAEANKLNANKKLLEEAYDLAHTPPEQVIVSGKELFDEAVNPVPAFAAVSNILKRFGLSPEASNRVAYQRLSESFAENLSQLQGATDLGLKEQDAKQGAKFIISRLQNFIDEQRPSRGLNVLTLNKNKQSALQDIRQMYTKEIAQALHISEESAKKVKGAILKAYTDVPMELRGLGTKLVDYAYKVPMVPEMYRIQSALRYTYNPFFRSQEVIETKLLSHMKANNLVWMKSKKTLDEAWAKLDNTELFTGAYTGQAAQDLTLGRMHANLLLTQRRDLAGLALDIAEKKGVSLDYMLQKSPEELIDALKVIVQYPTKGPLNSPLARTLNIAFFPMRYNLKVADMVAKEVSKLPATVQTAFIHSMFKFSDWLQSNEGIQWQSDNADVIGLFKYFTPYGNLESVFSTLNKGLNRTMPNSIGELGLLGGLPFGFISQMIDAQGGGSLGPFKFDTPYVNQKTGEVLPDYIPVTLRAKAAVAIQTLLGSLFTYPGRIIGLPGKSSLIRKQVDVFLNTKSSDYIKNYRTEDLTPVQQKWVNLLQHPDQITDDTLDELYTSPADGQFEFYTLPVDLPAPILTVNPKVKTSTRRAKKTALPLQKL